MIYLCKTLNKRLIVCDNSWANIYRVIQIDTVYLYYNKIGTVSL